MADVSLANLADHFKVASVVWSVARNDQLSGTGDGRVFVAELAPPLWTGDVVLAALSNDEAKQVAARIRALDGSIGTFLLYDPSSLYPQFDPDGEIIDGSTVLITAIASNARELSLSGLPASYRLTVGDKMQISYMQGSTSRVAFLEVSETKTGAPGGTLANLKVFPHIPAGVAVGDEVIFSRPACRVVVVPGSHNPGAATASHTDGQSFKVIQKK